MAADVCFFLSWLLCVLPMQSSLSSSSEQHNTNSQSDSSSAQVVPPKNISAMNPFGLLCDCSVIHFLNLEPSALRNLKNLITTVNPGFPCRSLLNGEMPNVLQLHWFPLFARFLNQSK